MYCDIPTLTRDECVIEFFRSPKVPWPVCRQNLIEMIAPVMVSSRLSVHIKLTSRHATSRQATNCKMTTTTLPYFRIWPQASEAATLGSGHSMDADVQVPCHCHMHLSYRHADHDPPYITYITYELNSMHARACGSCLAKQT